MTLYEYLRWCTGMCNESRVTCMKELWNVAFPQILCQLQDHAKQYDNDEACHNKRNSGMLHGNISRNGYGNAIIGRYHYKRNTLPWWYVFVTVGPVFCHACTSMTIFWQNQDSHTCVVVEVFHDITKIIITEVSTSMTINHASQKCFRQGWPTHGIHRNGMPLSYRVGFWIR